MLGYHSKSLQKTAQERTLLCILLISSETRVKFSSSSPKWPLDLFLAPTCLTFLLLSVFCRSPSFVKQAGVALMQKTLGWKYHFSLKVCGKKWWKIAPKRVFNDLLRRSGEYLAVFHLLQLLHWWHGFSLFTHFQISLSVWQFKWLVLV